MKPGAGNSNLKQNCFISPDLYSLLKHDRCVEKLNRDDNIALHGFDKLITIYFLEKNDHKKLYKKKTNTLFVKLFHFLSFCEVIVFYNYIWDCYICY